MVRRWSCVNSINIFLNFDYSFYPLKKKYKFINFKSTVSLKRFNKKYTKFKRKAFNRIKHVTNWFIYHNVFNFWAKTYCFYKKCNTNQFLEFMFQYNFMFYNFIFLRNNPILANNFSFNFFNSTRYEYQKNLLSCFCNKYEKNFFINKIIFKNVFFSSSLQSNTRPLITEPIVLFLNKDHSKFLLQCTDTNELDLDNQINFFFQKIILIKIKLIFELYKFFTQLVLLNTY